MDRKKVAKDLLLQGYNCAQAVAAAFADAGGYTFEQAIKLNIAGGTGFLHGGHLCGALTGMGFALGGIFGETDADGKKRFRERFEGLLKDFEKKFGNVNCCVLKPSAMSFECPFASKEECAAKACLVYVLTCVDTVEQLLS